MELMIGVIQQTLMITVFVLIMMLVIEYINVQTKGSWRSFFNKNKSVQILVAALLGAMPGCLGSYAVVSLYTHNIINFAALVTAMIATSGDEFFIMLSVIPKTAMILLVIITSIALITGFLINLLVKNQPRALVHAVEENHVHAAPDCCGYSDKGVLSQLKNISFQRALLIAGGLLFMFLTLTGVSMHLGETGHHSEDIWQKWIFSFSTIIGLFIVITVPDHFLEKHLWDHVIKKHFPKIFLWTFGAIAVIHLFEDTMNLENVIKDNMWVVLILAVLIGLIPESGPHIVFITLFAAGTIPFSILLANSIVQDGHGALPLLAESKRSFVLMKLVNALVGLVVGASGLIFMF